VRPVIGRALYRLLCGLHSASMARGGATRSLIRRTRSAAPSAGLLGSSWVWGAIVVVLGWRVSLAGPQAGFDPSWNTGLYMAAHEHLQFGRQIMYSYGPLGFLDFPLLAYPALFRLACLYTFVVDLTLLTVLVSALRRTLGHVVPAAVVSLLLFSIPMDPTIVIVAVGAIGALQGPPTSRRGYLLAAVAGAITGLEVLVKFNTGATVGAISLVTILALPGKLRTAGAYAASAVIACLGLWLASAQNLGNLWAFFRTSLSVVSGYSQALGTELPGVQWQYWPAFLLGALGVFAALRSGGLDGRPRRTGLVIVWCVLFYFEFKEGFVRHDDHSFAFFATLLGAFVGFRWAPGRRDLGVVTWLVFVLAYFAVTTVDPIGLVHVRSSVRRFYDDARVIKSPSALSGDVDAARQALAASYGFGRRDAALVAGRRVDVEPWEDSLAWAFSLDWSPAPEFQPFTAYTTLLDDANARAFSDPAGPERIAAQTPRTHDGRYPGFDAPAATRAILCHFAPLRVTSQWEILGRVPDRCGPARPLSTARAPLGAPVAVPRPPGPDQLVFVRVEGVQVAGLEELQAALFKARKRHITLGGRTYRLVPGTAADGLLISAPRSADDPGAYRLAPDVRTLSAEIGVRSPGHGEVRYAFFSMRITPRPER
jgi:hypothetical protein